MEDTTEEIIDDMDVDDYEEQLPHKEKDKEDEHKDNDLPKSATLVSHSQKEQQEGGTEERKEDIKENKEKEKEKEEKMQDGIEKINKPWLDTEMNADVARVEMTMTREDLTRMREDLETFMAQWRAHGSNLAEGEKVCDLKLYQVSKFLP